MQTTRMDVPANGMQNMVVVAVDGLQTGTALVPWAVAHAMQPRDELCIVHVDMNVRRSASGMPGRTGHRDLLLG